MQARAKLAKHPLYLPLLLLMAAALVVAVYAPGLNGPFVFDDGVNITQNPAVTEFSFASDKLGVIASQERPLAIASFALNWAAAGGASARSFKLTNLLVHLLNAGLVFWLLHWLADGRANTRTKPRTLAPRWFPILGAALWALHPIQLTSVLYVVQRMTALSATCVLAGLLLFVYGHRRLAQNESHGPLLMVLGIVGGTLLGFGFKENAVLLPLYAAVIEFAFFRDAWRKAASRKPLLAVYALSTAAIAAFVLLWLSGRGEHLGVYPLREFTMLERLLTEGRVLWFYAGLILLPQLHRFSLFHDDFTLSTGLLSPPSTVFALAGLAATVILALRFRRELPLLSFAVLWFVAGHGLESSVVGLELVHEHRNYLPSIGPIAAVAHGIAVLATRADKLRAPVAALGIGMVAAVALTTLSVARIWSSEQRLAEFLLRHHPESARAHTMLADMYYLEQREPLAAMHHYAEAARFAPHETALLIRIATIASMTEIASGVSQRQLAVPEPLKALAERAGAQVAIDKNRAVLRATPARLALIATRLQTQPVHARTSSALDELVYCIERQPRQCGYLLEHAISWYETAVHGKKTARRSLPGLYLSLVRLYLEKGDYAKARRAAREARTLEPRDGTLALMEANVLLLSGALGEAEQSLAAIRASHRLDDEQREVATSLERMLDDKRRALDGLKRPGATPAR